MDRFLVGDFLYDDRPHPAADFHRSLAVAAQSEHTPYAQIFSSCHAFLLFDRHNPRR